MGHWRGVGAPRRQGGVDLRRRRVHAVEHGAGDRGAAENNIVHVIWVDNAYNMVEMQEVNKYQRKSGVEFGPIDFKAYAESCGAVGFAVQSVDDLRPMLRKAMEIQGPVVVAIPVDYADNYKLMAQMNFSQMI